jgi:hypothetical protein
MGHFHLENGCEAISDKSLIPSRYIAGNLAVVHDREFANFTLINFNDIWDPVIGVVNESRIVMPKKLKLLAQNGISMQTLTAELEDHKFRRNLERGVPYYEHAWFVAAVSFSTWVLIFLVIACLVKLKRVYSGKRGCNCRCGFLHNIFGKNRKKSIELTKVSTNPPESFVPGEDNIYDKVQVITARYPDIEQLTETAPLK